MHRRVHQGVKWFKILRSATLGEFARRHNKMLRRLVLHTLRYLRSPYISISRLNATSMIDRLLAVEYT